MVKCAALFDLDGVVLDTERLYTRFYTALGKRYNLPDPDFALNIKGSTIEKILATYFPTPEASADVLKSIREFEENMDYPVCEGVVEFIDSLHGHDIRVALVTSSSIDKMRKVAARVPELLERFDVMVTGNDVSRSKPDPEGYILAAHRLGADPADCYVFEDSLSGLAAGMASGATVIGLATTLPAERLAGKAHKLIDGFAGFTVEDMLGVSRL